MSIPPSAVPSLRAMLRRSLAPRDGFARAMMALAVLRSLVVWLVSWIGRSEPFEVTAMYRPGGDVQYFEIVAAVARGNFGESNVLESAGTGMHPFPLGGIALHAACFRALGAPGLLVADMIAAYLFFVALTMLGRVVGLSERWSAGFTGFVATSLYAVFWPITQRLGWAKDLLWGDRFPRPLLTETFFIACVATALVLWLRPVERRSWRFWVLSGLGFSLLVQSDIYSAFIVGLVLLPVLGRAVIRSPARAALFKGLGGSAATIAATAWPFALQRTHASPELLVRWGAYPVARTTALGWIRFVQFGAPLVVFVVAALAILFARRRIAAAEIGSVAKFWALLTACTVVAMPLFFGILGQGLYPYMFPDRLRRICVYALAFIALEIAALLGKGISRRMAIGVPAVLIGGMVLGIGARAVEAKNRTTHTRRIFYDYSALGETRHEYAELVGALKERAASGDVVLGTLDQQVHVEWQTFRSGRSYVPDTWVSIVPDAEVERRLMRFSHLIGLSTEEFGAIVEDVGYDTIFLGDSKYAANDVHTFAPLSDYSAEQVRRIRGRDLYTSFQVEVPGSELRRLKAAYEADRTVAGIEDRIDVVVLTKEPRFATHAPSDPFELVYENRIYRVFARRH